MNMYPHLTDVRSMLINKFYELQTPARRDSIWARLTGETTSLALFPEEAPEKGPNRKFMGTQDIPVERIVGTLNRASDFDRQFRPLKSYLRDRWVNVYLRVENGGWPPILVHKVGENYYVEDGHHRVSVARSLGMTHIEAEVWEYSVVQQANECEQLVWCTEKSSANVYASQ